MKKILTIFLISLFSFFCYSEAFTFKSDKMSSRIAEGKELTILSGKAEIKSDTTVISADLIELSGKDFRIAKCAGNISVKDTNRGLFIQCPALVYDRKEKISVINGPSTMEDKKNKVVIKGSFIENNDTTEIVIIQIGVRILKDDMACRSEYALFHRKENVLELWGMPVVFWKGDEYRANKIIINLDTDDITLQGAVQGTISKESSKTQNTETKTEEKKSATSDIATSAVTTASTATTTSTENTIITPDQVEVEETADKSTTIEKTEEEAPE